VELSSSLGQVLTHRPFLAYGAAYLGGMLATASPCILASIPLVIGFVGGYAGGNKKQAFLYSLTFVLGLALVMSALGALAALLGTMFGMTGPAWYFILAAVLLVMGLHLAGLIDLKLATSQSLLPRRTGLLGALVMGMLFGTVLSPCASPVPRLSSRWPRRSSEWSTAARSCSPTPWARAPSSSWPAPAPGSSRASWPPGAPASAWACKGAPAACCSWRVSTWPTGGCRSGSCRPGTPKAEIVGNLSQFGL
jgi:MFS family permease